MTLVCCYYRIQSDSGDSGSWNVVSIIVPRCSSSNSLNLSTDETGELCSKGRVCKWIPDGSGIGGAPLPVPPLLGLPLLPPPLPRSGCLGNVAVGNLCPLEGMFRCTNVDFSANQSSGVDNR